MSGDTCGTAMGGALCSPGRTRRQRRRCRRDHVRGRGECHRNGERILCWYFEFARKSSGWTRRSLESSRKSRQIDGEADGPVGHHRFFCDSDPASTSNLYDSRRGHGVRRASHMSKGCGSLTSRGGAKRVRLATECPGPEAQVCKSWGGCRAAHARRTSTAVSECPSVHRAGLQLARRWRPGSESFPVDSSSLAPWS
jgi:hypothetical protein